MFWLLTAWAAVLGMLPAAPARAATPAEETVWVANSLDSTLTAISPNAGAEPTITRIVVRTAPRGVAATPDGAIVLAADYGSNEVSVISAADMRVTSGVDLWHRGEGQPIAIATTSTVAYIANYGPGTVTPVVLGYYNSPLADIKVGDGPSAIAITPDGRTAFVANRRSGTLTRIDLTASPPATSTIPGFREPRALAIAPGGTTVWVADAGANALVPVRDALAASPLVGPGIAGFDVPSAVAVTPDGRTVYVANAGTTTRPGTTVVPVDAATGVPGPAIGVGSGPDALALSSDGSLVWVANYGSGTISVIERASNQVVSTIRGVNGATSIAVADRGTPPTNTAPGPVDDIQRTIDQIYYSIFDEHPPSQPAPPPPYPDRPQSVLAEVAGPSSARVGWTAPVWDGGRPVTGYTVRAYTLTGAAAGAPVEVPAVPTAATVGGLVSGARHVFRVLATNRVAGEAASSSNTGPESAASNTARPGTVPGTPQGVAASGGNGSATISWRAPASDGGSAISSYIVTTYPGGATTSVPGGAAQAVVGGLANGTGYIFTVSATNGYGRGPASAASAAIVPGLLPSAPSGVSALAGNRSARVLWTPPSSDGGSPVRAYTATAYAGALAVAAATVDAPTTAATVSGLANGAAYTFRVTARNDAGTGPPSAATAPAMPRAPLALVATLGATGVAALDLSAPASPVVSTITTGQSSPAGVAITPDGSSAVVANSGASSVSVIDVPTGAVRATLPAGFAGPVGVAITPDGSKAFVANYAAGSGSTVTPVTALAGTPVAGAPIPVGSAPVAIAITPDGATAWVANYGSATVTPITVVTGVAGTPVAVGAGPYAAATAPDGRTLWVANRLAGTVSAVDLTRTPPLVTTISGFDTPSGLAVSPDGATLYVVNADGGSITPVATAAGVPGPDIVVEGSLVGMALSPSGRYAYVTDYGGWVVTVDLSSGLVASRVGGVASPFGIAVAPDQGPVASFRVTPGPAGASTRFDASGSATGAGSISTYAWQFGDGFNATTSFPTIAHTFATAGSYTATLTVTNSGGTSTAKVFTGQTMSRNGGPAARTTRSFSVGSPTPPGAPAVVRASAASRYASVRWSPAETGGSPVTGYTVTATPGGQTATVAGTVTSATVGGLTDGAAYTFAVVAANPLGAGPASSPSNPVVPGKRPALAWVANVTSNTVTAIDTAYDVTTEIVPLGSQPGGLAVSPDGSTAWVANFGEATVQPVDIATGTPGPRIKVGTGPAFMAITPDGATAYVANFFSNTVTPIDTLTGHAGSAIAIGREPAALAVSPDGRTLYVVNYSDASQSLQAVDVATNRAGPEIFLPGCRRPSGIAITPNGTTAYVTCFADDAVLPVNLLTGAPGAPITGTDGALSGAQFVAITPDGSAAYVTDNNTNTVTVIEIPANRITRLITVGHGPQGVAVTPDGNTVYIGNYGTNFGTSLNLVTPIDRTRSDATRADVAGGYGPATVAPVPDQAPYAAFTGTPWGGGSHNVTFDPSGSSATTGEIREYLWSFGDGLTESRTTPALFAHSYAIGGTYTVTLTVTSTAGTSTTQVFTGQTVGRNGGPQARATAAVVAG